MKSLNITTMVVYDASYSNKMNFSFNPEHQSCHPEYPTGNAPPPIRIIVDTITNLDLDFSCFTDTRGLSPIVPGYILMTQPL